MEGMNKLETEKKVLLGGMSAAAAAATRCGWKEIQIKIWLDVSR